MRRLGFHSARCQAISPASLAAAVRLGAGMSNRADPRVDAYIDALPGWQQAICREVRDLVHAADPEVVETIKRSRQPYFVLDGNICALLATRDHVNVFLYDGGIVDDPEHIITGGHDNATARTVATGMATAGTAAGESDLGLRRSRRLAGRLFCLETYFGRGFKPPSESAPQFPASSRSLPCFSARSASSFGFSKAVYGEYKMVPSTPDTALISSARPRSEPM